MSENGDLTATQIIEQVKAGNVTPVDAVRACLERIAERDGKLHAFTVVRREKALAEAEMLSRRTDLTDLPLAGLPIAVKDNVPVAGEVMHAGSAATSTEPASVDHPVVARLRAAGAIVVGLTAVPELCLWGATDVPGKITRNPWDLDRTPGGSSGGSGAAVASGMVAVAHGNDGLGSVRIPAANCGLFGLKPGLGVVPAELGVSSWRGTSENGALATTVADAALLLSVMADRPDLATIAKPGKLRIGLAVGSPTPAVRVDRHWTAAARSAGSVLVSAGHLVETATVPYPSALGALRHWAANAAEDAEELEFSKMQKRSRRHVRFGRLVTRLGLVDDAYFEKLHARLWELFANVDVVLTPALAQSPPEAKAYSEMGWLTNIVTNVRYAPFAAVWNLAGWPAASVPMGIHPVSGTPLAVQIASPPGGEATILALAAQLEERHPWQRLAPQ